LPLLFRKPCSVSRHDRGASFARRRIFLTSASRSEILPCRAGEGECISTLTFFAYIRLASAGYFFFNSGPSSSRYQKWRNLTCGPRLFGRQKGSFSAPIPIHVNLPATVALRLLPQPSDTDHRIESAFSDRSHAVAIAKHARFRIGIAVVRPFVDQCSPRSPHQSASNVSGKPTCVALLRKKILYFFDMPCAESICDRVGTIKAIARGLAAGFSAVASRGGRALGATR